MSDKPKLGRLHKGDAFPALKTPEDVVEEQKIQAPFNDPEAIPLDAYFQLKGINDHARKAGMVAFTKVQQATLARWNEIFAKF